MMRYTSFLVLVWVVVFSCYPTEATEYRLTGRVLEPDLKCAEKPAQGISGVAVTAECEDGGDSDDTDESGKYELIYRCEGCINMVITYEKEGYLSETRRVFKCNMSDGSLGDITLSKVEKRSDYSYDDIINLFLVLLETRVWLDWRETEHLLKVRSIWQRKFLEIEKDGGPAFQEAITTYPALYEKVRNSLQ